MIVLKQEGCYQETCRVLFNTQTQRYSRRLVHKNKQVADFGLCFKAEKLEVVCTHTVTSVLKNNSGVKDKQLPVLESSILIA